MYHDYAQYRRSGQYAIFTQVPIAYLDEFRAMNASMGKFYRIRYRGPRNTVHDRGRSRLNRQSTCSKAAATSFSVYRY
jgi:hypothetical protein